MKAIETIDGIIKEFLEPGKWYYMSFSVKKEGNKEYIDTISVKTLKENKEEEK